MTVLFVAWFHAESWSQSQKPPCLFLFSLFSPWSLEREREHHFSLQIMTFAWDKCDLLYLFINQPIITVTRFHWDATSSFYFSILVRFPDGRPWCSDLPPVICTDQQQGSGFVVCMITTLKWINSHQGQVIIHQDSFLFVTTFFIWIFKTCSEELMPFHNRGASCKQ